MSLLRRLLNRNLTLYSQLDTLAECGIVPNEGVGTAQLLARHCEREYETSPFKLLLSVLGTDSPEPPLHSCHVRQLWHMRAECIAGRGDYVKVALRMAHSLGAPCRSRPWHDEFDWRQGVVWLGIHLRRARGFRWPAKIEERWIDPTILSRFVALLDRAGHRPALHRPRPRRPGLPHRLRH